MVAVENKIHNCARWEAINDIVKMKMQIVAQDIGRWETSALKGHVSTRFMKKYSNIDLGKISDDQTLISDMTFANDVLELKFQALARDLTTNVFRIEAVPYWDLSQPPEYRRLKYTGSQFIAFNASTNCVKGISVDASYPNIYVACKKQNYMDPNAQLWETIETVNSTNDIRPGTEYIYSLDYNYVYCFKNHLTINGITESCPTMMLKIPSTYTISNDDINLEGKSFKLNTTLTVGTAPSIYDDVNVKHFIHDIHHQELKFLQTIEDRKKQISMMSDNFRMILKEKELLANSTKNEHDMVEEQRGVIYYLSLIIAITAAIDTAIVIAILMFKMGVCLTISRLIFGKKKTNDPHLESNLELSQRSNTFRRSDAALNPPLPTKPARFAQSITSNARQFEIPSSVAILADQIYGTRNMRQASGIIYDSRPSIRAPQQTNYINLEELDITRQKESKQSLREQLAGPSNASERSDSLPREV